MQIFKKKDWEFMGYGNVLGVCRSKKKINKFYNRFTRVGGISVEYLKDFLKKVDDELDMAEIGIYIDKKKQLVPIHCRGVMLAPRLPPDKECLKRRLEDEGR